MANRIMVTPADKLRGFPAEVNTGACSCCSTSLYASELYPGYFVDNPRLRLTLGDIADARAELLEQLATLDAIEGEMRGHSD